MKPCVFLVFFFSEKVWAYLGPKCDLCFAKRALVKRRAAPSATRLDSIGPELDALLSVSIHAKLASRHVEKDKGLEVQKEEAENALCEAVWEGIDVESQGGSNVSNWWPATTDDFAGLVLESYLHRCQSSMKRAPIGLVAAAAASAAMVGEVELAYVRLKAILGSEDPWIPQRLGSRLRSKVIIALCEAPARTEACLDLALALLDPSGTKSKDGLGSNAWLSQRARRSLLEAMLRQARRETKLRSLRDDETALLSSGGETNEDAFIAFEEKKKDQTRFDSIQTLNQRRLADILPTEEYNLLPLRLRPSFSGCSSLLSQAEALGRGAVRGRSKREVLARVAALAYHNERRPARCLDAVSKALGRASDGCAPATAPADVLRAVLREALSQGDSEAADTLLEELALRESARRIDQDSEKKKQDQYDLTTLDIVLWAAAEDGDAPAAARILKARQHNTEKKIIATSGKQAQAFALALRAAVPAVAAGRMELDDVLKLLDLSHDFTYIAHSSSRLVRLAGVQLAAAAAGSGAVAFDDAFFKAAVRRDGSRALLAALRGLEVLAAHNTNHHDPIEEEEFYHHHQQQQQKKGASGLVAQLLKEYYYAELKVPPAAVCDAAMRIFAIEGATRLAVELWRSRPASDTNALYGLLRSLALAPDTADALSIENEDRLGIWSQLALAVAAARNGDPGRAIDAWRRLEEEQSAITPAARAALLAGLVSHPRCVAAAARLLDQLEKQREIESPRPIEPETSSNTKHSASMLAKDDQVLLQEFMSKEEPRYQPHLINSEDEGQRVRAALARRLGNARNWAAAGRESVIIPGAVQMVVGETAYARLVSAMVRSLEAKNAREAVVLLSRYGVRVDLARLYLDDAAPRKGRLYKALFGSAASQRESTNTQAEVWYDSRVDRASAPLNPGRDRKQVRESVLATATSSSFPSLKNGGNTRNISPDNRRPLRPAETTAAPPASKILARLSLHPSTSSSTRNNNSPSITLAARFDDEDLDASSSTSSR